MEKLVERIDFGVREELDFPVDWEIFSRGRQAPEKARDHGCGRAVASPTVG